MHGICQKSSALPVRLSPARRRRSVAVVAVLAAAGDGNRFGAAKQFLPLAGHPVLWHAARPFVDSSRVDMVVVVVRGGGEDEEKAKDALADFGEKCKVLPRGGETRAVSVRNGLAECGDDDWALVHDAARPCLPADALARLLDDEDADGAALAMPLADALRTADDGRVSGVVPKEGHWLMQTPQKFPAVALRAALAAFPDAADEAEAMWRCGKPAKLLFGDSRNIKITHPGDMALAAALLGDVKNRLRL